MSKFFASVALLIVYLILSCGSKSSYIFLDKAGINSTEWKTDTFGCLSYRYKKTDAILGLRQQLLNLNKKEIISFFGDPNLKRALSDGNEIFFYINQPNLYCEGKTTKENILKLEVTSIHFIFDKTGKVLDVGMKIP